MKRWRTVTSSHISSVCHEDDTHTITFPSPIREKQQFVTEPDGATQRYTRLCTAEEICVTGWDHMGLSAGD